MKRSSLVDAFCACILFTITTTCGASAPVVITMMEIGDHHGTMVSRPNLRPGDSAGQFESGLARIATVVKRVRKEDPAALLFNSGDTIQGSAEAIYTAGQAMVDVLDTFDINAYAPGNWDWLYGKNRIVELFGGGRWGIVAANAYDAVTGERIFPAYRILEVKGVKIGVIGMTSARGIPPVPTANVGLRFTDGEDELVQAIDDLRNVENVEIVVLLSELGLAKNTLLVDRHPGVDVVFSSDMHEETPNVIITPGNRVLAVEIGWGGSRLAKLKLYIEDGQIVSHDYEWIPITQRIKPDPATAKHVRAIRAPFMRGTAFTPHVNPINGAILDMPIDTVIGIADQPIYRGNFTDHPTLPGVAEGTSHDLITDAFRTQGGADIGTIRGFRYGTYVRKGPVTLADLYTYLNAGAQIATGEIPGQQIKNVLENSINGTLNRDPLQWGGGWLFGFSGLRYDLDLSVPLGGRAQNIMVLRQATGLWEPLDFEETYSISGYFYSIEPNRVGAFRNAANVQVITKPDGPPKDATEVVIDYLREHRANPETGRVRLLQMWPPPVFGNPEIQPLRGAAAE